jgi:hypothetical protein
VIPSRSVLESTLSDRPYDPAPLDEPDAVAGQPRHNLGLRVEALDVSGGGLALDFSKIWGCLMGDTLETAGPPA